MLDSFPITQVDAIIRKTLWSAGGAGVLAITAAIALGYPLIAPGIVIGLVMAVLNHRVFQASALRFTTEEGKVQRKPFAGSVFLRLGLCTAVAVLLLIVVQPMGWGVIGALVMFQSLLLLNAIVALIRLQREEITGDR
ncbi:MAG: hypothetical protein M3Y91_17445 [Actinomycetota bacterium]|nr:hypothetical protein [Actinomycetota bacterium]